ncbi:hypothetical protein H4R20_006419, partial [Coemansia guatemalensis]
SGIANETRYPDRQLCERAYCAAALFSRRHPSRPERVVQRGDNIDMEGAARFGAVV